MREDPKEAKEAKEGPVEERQRGRQRPCEVPPGLLGEPVWPEVRGLRGASSGVSQRGDARQRRATTPTAARGQGVSAEDPAG